VETEILLANGGCEECAPDGRRGFLWVFCGHGDSPARLMATMWLRRKLCLVRLKWLLLRAACREAPPDASRP
jgi:hypothetical protein